MRWTRRVAQRVQVGRALRRPDVASAAGVLAYRSRSNTAFPHARDDFAAMRELTFPGDKRRLMDMRRSGVVEAIAATSDRSDCRQSLTVAQDLCAARN